MSMGDPYPVFPQSGWQCPNCGRAHAPSVLTCTEPPKAQPWGLGPIYSVPPGMPWWQMPIVSGDPPGSVGGGMMTSGGSVVPLFGGVD
jgi:hypothetical protein